MTIDRYNEMKNEAKLYAKLHEDYTKKLNNLEKERQSEEALAL